MYRERAALGTAAMRTAMAQRVSYDDIAMWNTAVCGDEVSRRGADHGVQIEADVAVAVGEDD
jgi:hypothetical protein